jgi:short-subunit dehydrogenase
MALPPPDPATTCLITGASSGIGAELAKKLAARGHGVTLSARREERLKGLAEELTGRYDVRIETVSVDVADEESRSRLVNELSERGLTVDVLVNNAGYGSGGRFVSLDAGTEAAMVRLNCEAVVALAGAFLPGMVERGRGALMNIASSISFQPVPNQATYGASKAFVLSFTEAIAEELRGTGVTATAVCPGPVRTEFGEQGGFGGADERIPARLWLQPERVADEALRALAKGQRVVVPGVHNRVGAVFGRHLPRGLLLPLLRRAWPVN